jgi:acetyltransferase-like isoleucine patch superfamily enzyme
VIPGLEWARQILYTNRLRRRFPCSVIYHGAVADQGCVLGEHSVLFRGTRLIGSALGAYSYVQAGSAIYNSDIGPFCSIAENVTIGLDGHPTFMVSTSPVFYDNTQPLPRFLTQDRVFTEASPRTTIGADVWIGQGAIIRAGVRIGVGAVIGSASMVTKDVPPYTIAAGNPCRPIRQRFTEETCRKLIESRWWDFHESKLMNLASLFSNPDAFLAAIGQGNE